MKIARVNTALVKGFGEWTLVRVETDKEIYGLGETFRSFDGNGHVIETMIRALSTELIGQDPMPIGRLKERLYRYFHGSFGTNWGLTSMAISGIEMALWDLKGKALGAPVYDLLGGAFRDRLRLYADSHAGETTDPADYGKKAREMVAQGYDAVKFDIGMTKIHESQYWFTGRDGRAHVQGTRRDPYGRTITPADLDYLVSLAEAVRGAVGPNVDVAVDAQLDFDVISAIKIAKAYEPFNLMWLEDPVPPENVEGMAKVTAATNTPILTGECLYTRFGFKDLIQKQAADIISPDINKAGGLIEARRIAELADMYYISVAPHCSTGPVGTVGAAHLCAAIPNFYVLEFHCVDIPYWSDLVITDRPLIQDGYLHLSEKPGLGIELNEEVVRKHLAPGSTYFGSAA
jgi:L-alanine-DL-glutamate epimerase-like enolase superfamily enzyme